MEIMQTATYGNPLFAVTIETSVPTERLFVNQETVMTTVITTHTGKPVVQHPAVKIPQHHLPDIGAQESVSVLEPIFKFTWSYSTRPDFRRPVYQNLYPHTY